MTTTSTWFSAQYTRLFHCTLHSPKSRSKTEQLQSIKWSKHFINHTSGTKKKVREIWPNHSSKFEDTTSLGVHACFLWNNCHLTLLPDRKLTVILILLTMWISFQSALHVPQCSERPVSAVQHPCVNSFLLRLTWLFKPTQTSKAHFLWFYNTFPTEIFRFRSENRICKCVTTVRVLFVWRRQCAHLHFKCRTGFGVFSAILYRLMQKLSISADCPESWSSIQANPLGSF